MPTIAIQAAELSGTTGNTLWIYTEAGVLQNTGGDTLSESPASSGRFTATVAETLTGTLFCVVKDSDGFAVRDGYLADGETIIQPGYPSAGGSGSSTTAVLPASINQIKRQVGSTITVFNEELATITRTVYDAAGDPVNLSVYDLIFAVCIDDEEITMVDSTDAITLSGTGSRTFSVQATASMVATIGDGYIWSLRDVTGGKNIVIAHGPWVVAKAAIHE